MLRNSLFNSATLCLRVCEFISKIMYTYMQVYAVEDLYTYICLCRMHLLSCTTKNLKGSSKMYNVMVENLHAQK